MMRNSVDPLEKSYRSCKDVAMRICVWAILLVGLAVTSATTTHADARAPLVSGKVSEDCLYLNIWTPARRSKSKLPVMVWIYGGGQSAGSGSSSVYWGDKLGGKGVITVNLSYRVGSFGFLSHSDLSAESGHGTSGNYGVLDMIAALR
jgi:para-nitrobenzyl esterase